MNNFAHLKRESEWYGLFENGMAPIQNVLLPVRAHLEGLGPAEVHLVDVAKLTEEQKRKIAEAVAAKKNAKASEVLAWMEDGGVIPIRADQCNGTCSDTRAFL